MPRLPVIFTVLASLAPAQEKVTYDDHVFAIFQQSCLNCHNPDKTKGGLDLSTFAGAMKGSSGGKIVEPGDIGSTLISVVRQTSEPKMPPEGDKLSNEQIQILQHWIEGGLLENPSSSVRKPSRPKFETSPHTDPAAKPEGPPPMPADLLLEPPVVTAHASAVRALAASPWAPLIAVTGQRQVLLHHAESLELIGILPFPEGDPVSLAFTPDARYLIVGGGVPGKSGVTITFDVTNGSRLLSAAKEFDSILAADIRPGFDIVATGGPSRLLKLWNTESGKQIQSIKKHTDWITALDISPDGVLLASGDRNGGVWVWESETANEFHTLRGHQAAITATVFRADSNILATASEDGSIRFWEMNGGSEVKKIDAHSGGVTAFSFARDGSSLSVGRDFKAKLWKTDFNHARDLSQKLPSLPTAAALDAEGKRAFVGDASGAIHVFSADEGKEIGEFQNNPPTIETRLAAIDVRITDQEKTITDSKAHLAAQTATRDQARQAFDTAEKSLRQATEILKAAREGASQGTDDASKKLAEDAQGRISTAEKAVQAQHDALNAAEKSLAEATAADESAQAPLLALKKSRKHWAAAAINTRALATRALSESSALSTEESQRAFTDAAEKISRQAEILNHKRQQRALFATRKEDPGISPETRVEMDATLAAIDLVIARQLDVFRNAEVDFEQFARTIDLNARLAHENKLEAESLQQAYHKALE